MENLIEGLQREANRVRDLIKVYESIPNNAGALAAIMMGHSISNAEREIAKGDTIGMMLAYSDLETYEL